MILSLIVTSPTIVYTLPIENEIVALAAAAQVAPLAQPGVTTARQLVEPLQAALDRLATEGNEQFGDLVPVLEQCLEACHAYPDAEVHLKQ